MSNTCWTSSNSNDVITGSITLSSTSCLRLFFRHMTIFFGIHQSANFLRRLSSAQACTKVWVKQKCRQAAQYLKMHIGATGWSCNQEKQCCWLPISRIKVNTAWHHHGRKPWSRNCIGLCMRDSNAITQACRELCFTLANGSSVGVLINNVAFVCHKVNEFINRFVLVSRGTPNLDTFRFE